MPCIYICTFKVVSSELQKKWRNCFTVFCCNSKLSIEGRESTCWREIEPRRTEEVCTRVYLATQNPHRLQFELTLCSDYLTVYSSVCSRADMRSRKQNLSSIVSHTFNTAPYILGRQRPVSVHVAFIFPWILIMHPVIWLISCTLYLGMSSGHMYCEVSLTRWDVGCQVPATGWPWYIWGLLRLFPKARVTLTNQTVSSLMFSRLIFGFYSLAFS